MEFQWVILDKSHVIAEVQFARFYSQNQEQGAEHTAPPVTLTCVDTMSKGLSGMVGMQVKTRL